MAQKVRDAKLGSRTNRLKQISKGERRFKVLGNGIALCYRRSAKSYGTWSARVAMADGRYVLEAIGMADDHQEADGSDVLTFEQAQAKALEIQARLQRAGGKIRGSMTVDQAADEYLEWFRHNRKSIKETESTIAAHIRPKLGKLKIVDLTKTKIAAWHSGLAKKPARVRSRLGAALAYRDAPDNADAIRSRKASANRILTVLRAILNKAYEDEHVPSDEAWRKVKPFEKVDVPRVRFLSPSEAVRLVNACQPDLRQLVQAALNTGARYSELAGANVSDFSKQSRTLFIQPGKSGKARHIPLTDEGVKLLESCSKGKVGSDALFTREGGAVWGKNHHVRALLEACRVAKIIPAVGFHELRHTYASILAQAGADLLTISKLLGHADTRVTSRHYAHLTDRTLANAVNALLPAFGGVESSNVSALEMCTG